MSIIQSSLQHSIKRRIKRDDFELIVKDLNVTNNERLTMMVNFSLAELSKQRAIKSGKPGNLNRYKYSLVEILSANQLTGLVDDQIYNINIKIKQADCSQNCQMLKCDLQLIENVSENLLNLTSYDCLKLKKLPMLAEIRLNDTQALNALDYVINILNQESNDTYLFKLVKINKISRQDYVVKFIFDFNIGRTFCPKNNGTFRINLDQCSLQNQLEQKRCKVDLLYRQWVVSDQIYTITYKSCIYK